ncbi:type VI secretion system contractile sheath large subunit [Mangrovitalea sediminis]|uniref:type VI secretion system contractile sheath large subunit n=1 Tax=Mangrovitalea sediminis TaxID=1982043 RepID=UPI00130416BE|nr:type VI secretion system contractile sheath large subunit [Mangrovitalea sediminis]
MTFAVTAQPEARLRLHAPATLRRLEEETVPSPLRLPMHDAALDRFLTSEAPWETLLGWLANAAPAMTDYRTSRIRALLAQCIADIDERIERQLNEILHHPQLQALEASWRGLHYLAEQMDGADTRRRLKIRVLNVSWSSVCKDLEKAIEFDQSVLFRKIYSDEFDTPGGEPFGILLGDYQLSHRPRPEQRTRDMDNLQNLSQIAAAAFAPFITSAHPSLFGLDSYRELSSRLNLAEVFKTPEYLGFNRLRNQEDLRFVGLTLPRVLMRRPYTEAQTRHHRLRFREKWGGNPDFALWGNAVYAFGATVLRAYAQHGWFANIRGSQRNLICGGLVTDLPAQSLPGDQRGLISQAPVETLISERLEKELAELGLLALCSTQDSRHLVFYGNPSLHRPSRYNHQEATANANLSSMLQYTLCVSRFAHYLKVIGRDKVGAFISAQECERFLQNWILEYATANDSADQEMKAKRPLREARIDVKEMPGQPGHYLCQAHLKPHFQLDQLNSSLRLVTEIAPPRHGG